MYIRKTSLLGPSNYNFIKSRFRELLQLANYEASSQNDAGTTFMYSILFITIIQHISYIKGLNAFGCKAIIRIFIPSKCILCQMKSFAVTFVSLHFLLTYKNNNNDKSAEVSSVSSHEWQSHIFINTCGTH